MPLTEDTFEQSIIELFETTGYTPLLPKLMSGEIDVYSVVTTT